MKELVLSYGELWSSQILTALLTATCNKTANFMDAREVNYVAHIKQEQTCVCCVLIENVQVTVDM